MCPSMFNKLVSIFFTQYAGTYVTPFTTQSGLVISIRCESKWMISYVVAPQFIESPSSIQCQITLLLSLAIFRVSLLVLSLVLIFMRFLCRFPHEALGPINLQTEVRLGRTQQRSEQCGTESERLYPPWGLHYSVGETNNKHKNYVEYVVYQMA